MAEHNRRPGAQPVIHPGAFVATGAVITGDVEIQEGASVWALAVIRADHGRIVVGRNSNIQGGAVLHCDRPEGLVVGPNCTVGHRAQVRGLIVGRDTLVGRGAVVMPGAVVGEGCILRPGALVGHDLVVPPRSVVAGVPGSRTRAVNEDELRENRFASVVYQDLARMRCSRPGGCLPV